MRVFEHVFTVADFCDQDEADVEDLLAPSLFVSILNGEYGLTGKHELTDEKLAKSDENTERQVQKAEAYFRLLPEEIEEFDPFRPSSWLIQHPDALSGNGNDVKESLDRFEQVFESFNGLLDGSQSSYQQPRHTSPAFS